MKLFVVLLVCVVGLLVYTATIFPLIPGDNSFYVEGKSRYIWMPDGEGVPHIVDLEAPPREDLLVKDSKSADNQYWLFTRRNPRDFQKIIYKNDSSLLASNYNASLPTAVIVHGWRASGDSPMNPLITEAFLAVGDFNVIVVDWSRLANMAYTTAVICVPDVGVHLGKFLNWVFGTAGGNWSDLHLVGFSLGAHVVGNAGRTTSEKPGRVTGLDPAGPLWTDNPDALNTKSGVYVESIHTDGRLLGMLKPISHADFYPNGGTNPQPGCWLSTCSHSRAPQLFASSVTTNHFVGHQCANLTEAKYTICRGKTFRMGNALVGKEGSGLYGLLTGSNWPF